MRGEVEVPSDLAPVWEAVAESLARVEQRFDAQLRSDLPPVGELCAHVERYRGKMLRPTLVVLSGLAAHAGAGEGETPPITDAHVTIGAVVEMVHMATLVHDDVLDEADVRRRGVTVNRLRGNEAAVILGDYLIASAYHLCSTLATTRAAEAVGRASMVLCEGELLQLHHRNDCSLDEPTYEAIIDRKTAELVAVAAELGAWASGATRPRCASLARFARKIGMAFQVQDDLLDLLGDEQGVGKSTGKDLEKGKLTLPLIHHLASAPPLVRGRTLASLRRIASGGPVAAEVGLIRRALVETGSLEYARSRAARLVDEGKAHLGGVPDSPARRVLALLADRVLTRSS